MASFSSGRCLSCGCTFAKNAMLRHLRGCLTRMPPSGGPASRLIALRVEGAWSTSYWLDLEVKERAPLEAVDRFLRDIWLECCGHLSAFEVGEIRYTQPFDDGMTDGVERGMSTTISRALGTTAGWIRYAYDFGSTTRLRLRVTGVREASVGRALVHLRARNLPPAWKCGVCSRPAASVCSFCQGQATALVCALHARSHECGDEGLLPVVNSPRMGVCGYTGEPAD